jgi:hypothetical protein
MQILILPIQSMRELVRFPQNVIQFGRIETCFIVPTVTTWRVTAHVTGFVFFVNLMNRFGYVRTDFITAEIAGRPVICGQIS